MSYFLLLPKFAAGQIILSPLIQTCDVDALPLLRRHLAGDWTDQDEHDCDSNEKALLNDEAILTLYEAVDSKGWRILAFAFVMPDRTRIFPHLFRRVEGDETNGPAHRRQVHLQGTA